MSRDLETRVEDLEERLDFIEYEGDSVFDDSSQKLLYKDFRSQFIAKYPFGKQFLVAVEGNRGGGKLIYQCEDTEHLTQMISDYTEFNDNKMLYDIDVREERDGYRFIVER